MKEIFKKGIWEQNPIFVLLLGLCSSLAITTTITNALGMGIAVTAVLILSNIIISALRKVIPGEIRIPVYIVVIATLVKSVQLLLNAFASTLYSALGVFIPLIVVNCIILGRAESFASKHTPIESAVDGLSNGLGYTLAVVIIATVRQLLGTGVIELCNPFNSAQVLFTLPIMEKFAVSIFTQPAGALLTLGTIIGVINTIQLNKAKKAEAKKGEE